MALSNNGGKKVNPERELVKTAQYMTTSVFACDFWNVFSDVPLQLKHAPNGHAKVVDYTKAHYSNGTAVQRPNTKIFVNTLLFVNVWKYIKHQTTWDSWVVKVGTIRVFIPSWLRWWLPIGVYVRR